MFSKPWKMLICQAETFLSYLYSTHPSLFLNGNLHKILLDLFRIFAHYHYIAIVTWVKIVSVGYYPSIRFIVSYLNQLELLYLQIYWWGLDIQMWNVQWHFPVSVSQSNWPAWPAVSRSCGSTYPAYTGKAGQAVCILCSLTSACLVSLSLHLWTPQAARNDTDQGWSEHSKAKG